MKTHLLITLTVAAAAGCAVNVPSMPTSNTDQPPPVPLLGDKQPMPTEIIQPRCRACGSTDLVPVVYGMPVPGTRRPDIHFGGCLPPADGKPRAICRTCGKLMILDHPLQVQPTQPSAPVTTNPCPRCGLEGRHLVPVVYGMPVPMPGPLLPDIRLGGCMPPADGKPRAACPRCGLVIILDTEKVGNGVVEPIEAKGNVDAPL
jgi:hypothetical protein